MSQKFLISIGTRPEIIKMMPVYFELKKRGLQPILLHTGQHDEMATAFYKFFEVTPDYNINLDRQSLRGEYGDDLSALSSLLLKKISYVLFTANPSVVLVHGDTSSALISALAAFYQQREIAHIEAGLRSHNEYNPFPEEKNRVMIAKLARLHFAPTIRAKENLLAEGVEKSAIHVVGNTGVDAANLGVEKLGVKKYIADGKKLLLVTMHRRENLDGNIVSVAKAIVDLLQKYDDLVVVWSVHPNPKVKMAVHDILNKTAPVIAERINLTEPLDYPELLSILKNAWLVLTDSGGIQEESVALSTPVLILRETTERPEIIEVGAGILVGTNRENIVEQVEKLYNSEQLYNKMCNVKNPFGDGTAAVKICDILLGEKNA